MFTCSYRSFSASVTVLRTVASASVRSLTKHHHQKKNALFLCPVSSNTKRKFSCESLKQDVGHITTANSVTGDTEYNRLLPYPSDNGLPRTEHLVVSEAGPVLDYICKALDLPPLFVADLIHFGAVHYAVVCPQLLSTETPEHIGAFEEVTAPSILKKRASIEGKTVREAQKTSRITHVDQFLEAGTYLRVHIHPKRFPSHPEYNRLLPCPSDSGPPRIEHLVVSEEGPVLDYICKALGLPPLYVADLIKFGAVHYALVCPQPPPTATPEQIRVFEEVTEPSVLKKRASIKGKTVREAQKTFRITHADQFLEAGSYLRVHVHPKRFPRCYDIDWKSRIIAVAESYVVLDKPAGTSVGGTIDNIEESCANFATRALGLTTPLMTTHQIDNCTEGCLVLARTKEYCSVFHGKIREKTVKKLYLALAASPVPVGVITHYMRPVNIAPRLVSKEFIRGWHLCQLEVIECKKVPWPNAVIEEKYCVEDCGWPSKDYAYECKINLLTGRTHQIRAQLADLGAPLVGDSIYMPAAIAEMVSPGLNPFGNHKKQYSSEDDKAIAVKEWVAQHGKEPNVAIGLQACQISWDEGKQIYNARSPWWMQNDIK